MAARDGRSGEGLSVGAFRGLRFDPAVVADLGAVTSPPYDVLDSDAVLSLESTDTHNVVRLILPRDEESGPQGRYEHAARTLRGWVADGVLQPEAVPALYVYEQSVGSDVVQRGLIGAVGLVPEGDRVVLPHEDVMPGPVADRLALMQALRANVEPILLMYDGRGGLTAQVLAETAKRPPDVEARTPDGIRHRLWAIVDRTDHERIADDLRPRQALIADGHHRYAAYRALQAAHNGDAGPWDRGLALLVDLNAHPPRLGAIHRVVSGLAMDDAVDLAAPLFSVRERAPDATPRQGSLLLDDAEGRVVELIPHDADQVGRIIATHHPDEWRRLDTATLHAVLLDLVWHIPDDQVSYHHTAEQALQHARREHSLAIRLAPVEARTVLELASAGVRMPRKSTSFGPKPRTGLVLRTFEPV